MWFVLVFRGLLDLYSYEGLRNWDLDIVSCGCVVDGGVVRWGLFL